MIEQKPKQEVEIPINPDAHVWNEGVVKTFATCTEEGKMTYTCKNDSSHTKIETIPVDENAHDWGEWMLTKEPTTEMEGEETRICQNDRAHAEVRAVDKLTVSKDPVASNGTDSLEPSSENKVDGTQNSMQKDETDKSDSEQPKTGDTSNPWLFILLMGAGAAGAGTSIVLLKKNSKKE